MSLLISGDLYLSRRDFDVNNGIIGWRNYVTATGISADSSREFFPPRNMASPLTNPVWRSDSLSEQAITVNFDGVSDVDYIGIARHNLGSGDVQIAVQWRGALDAEYEALILPIRVGTDDPIIIRFRSILPASIQIVLTPGDTKPAIGVLYMGELTALERNVYVGHTPISMAHTVRETVGISEFGQYLGRVIKSEGRATSVELSNLTPVWVRSKFEPFKQARVPFFYSWRPRDYPLEIGYCWFPANHAPRPVNILPNGMMAASFEMEGAGALAIAQITEIASDET